MGNDITYERKLREIIVASRIERALTKAEILELYLNSIYLGRGAWGVEMAARSYFGKPAKALTAIEGAMLAGLAKGPNYFNPDRHLRARATRFAYVLGRMQEDDMIDAADGAGSRCRRSSRTEPTRQDFGFHFVDHVPARQRRSPASTRSMSRPTRCARPSIRPCSASSKHHCRRASRGTN